MKIVTIFGTRPQFIKLPLVSKALKKHNIKEILVNTGQHYDYNMSDIFIQELGISKVKYNLNIGSLSHALQTAEILINFEKILNKESPDGVIVYGDTNSTLGGAITAAKLNIPIFHIESGLRSYNKKMPEEINRIITDNISSILFCPSAISKNNLSNEGIKKNVHIVGDVMFDIFKKMSKKYFQSEQKKNKSCLLTMHRAENTTKQNLRIRLNQLSKVENKIIYPIHPRVKNLILKHKIKMPENITTIEPQSWINLMKLAQASNCIITDSGGLQKEAFWLKKRCYTLRNETEWTETIQSGSNKLINLDEDEINFNYSSKSNFDNPYGNGNASKKIAKIIHNYLA